VMDRLHVCMKSAILKCISQVIKPTCVLGV
jgi:hypothetical protein